MGIEVGCVRHTAQFFWTVPFAPPKRGGGGTRVRFPAWLFGGWFLSRRFFYFCLSGWVCRPAGSWEREGEKGRNQDGQMFQTEIVAGILNADLCIAVDGSFSSLDAR